MAIFNNNSERQGAQLPASSSLTRPQRSKTHDRPSRLLDLAGNLISLKRVSDYPIESQSEIGTKSECSVKDLKVKSTFALQNVLDSESELETGTYPCQLRRDLNQRGSTSSMQCSGAQSRLEEVRAEEDAPDSTKDGCGKKWKKHVHVPSRNLKS